MDGMPDETLDIARETQLSEGWELPFTIQLKKQRILWRRKPHGQRIRKKQNRGPYTRAEKQGRREKPRAVPQRCGSRIGEFPRRQ